MRLWEERIRCVERDEKKIPDRGSQFTSEFNDLIDISRTTRIYVRFIYVARKCVAYRDHRALRA